MHGTNLHQNSSYFSSFNINSGQGQDHEHKEEQGGGRREEEEKVKRSRRAWQLPLAAFAFAPILLAEEVKEKKEVAIMPHLVAEEKKKDEKKMVLGKSQEDRIRLCHYW